MHKQLFYYLFTVLGLIGFTSSALASTVLNQHSLQATSVPITEYYAEPLPVTGSSCSLTNTYLGLIPSFKCIADALALRVAKPKPVITLTDLVSEVDDATPFTSIAQSLYSGSLGSSAPQQVPASTNYQMSNNLVPTNSPVAPPVNQYDIDVPQSAGRGGMFIHVSQ